MTDATTVTETASMFAGADWALVFAVIGALLSIILAGAGSSIACAKAGQKSCGVMAEKPELFTKLLLLTALPGSQGVYGLLIAFLILFQVGFFSGDLELTKAQGMSYLFAGLIMGLIGYISAIFQGRAIAAGVGGVAKDGSIATNAVVLAAIVETNAIFGFLIALFVVLFS